MLRLILAALLVLTGSLAVSAQSSPNEPDTSCETTLHWLQTVRKEQIAAIASGSTISITRICEGDPLEDSGNTVGLAKSLDAVPAIHDALKRQGFRADQVVGIAITGGFVELWVYAG
ncbi:MAG: hypothetical protein ABI697_03255 [Devosia sp.]